MELWAPQTLHEAVYWAAIQESLLEEKLLFEAPKDMTAVGECQSITVEESLMIQANNNEIFEFVEKKSGGLTEELELQVERRVVVTTYDNELFAEIFRVRTQDVVDQIPSVTLCTMKESVATFVDVAEESVIIPDYVHDSQRQTKDVHGMGSHFMRPNLKVSAANTYGLNKNHGNIFGGEIMIIFDPGGLELLGQPCVIKMPKQMIKKIFQDVSQGNVWFCPILKQCTASSSLNFSMESIFDMMGLLTKKSKAHEREEHIYLSRTAEGLTYTLWLLPPSFCNYPLAMAVSFKELAKILWGKPNKVAVKLPRMLWRPGISFTDRSEARQLQSRTTFVAVTTSPLVYSCWETCLVCYKKATFLNVSWLTSTLHLHTQRRRLLRQKFQHHDLRGAAIQPSLLSPIWNASTLAIVEMRFLAWYWNALCLVFDPGDCDYLKFSQILSFLRTRMFLRGRECNRLMDLIKMPRDQHK